MEENSDMTWAKLECLRYAKEICHEQDHADDIVECAQIFWDFVKE